MRVNDKALAEISSGKAVIEGRLNHKKTGGSRAQGGFKERWFKLRLNVLFYFNLSDAGSIPDNKPTGAIIIENCSVNCEEWGETPFEFSLSFKDEKDRKHVFSGSSEDSINSWIAALQVASYEYWRTRLIHLQKQLTELTGQDPLLLYYKSKGIDISSEKVENPAARENLSKTSFRSYISPADSNVESLASAFADNMLTFNEHHFGNGLEAIGSLSKESATKSKEARDMASKFFLDADSPRAPYDTSSAISRPRPLRKAPEAPTRPPRGTKGSAPAPAASANLIDL